MQFSASPSTPSVIVRGPETVVTFLNRLDTYRFSEGDVLYTRKPYTGFGRLWAAISRPFRKRCVVVAVHYDVGTITIANEVKWYRFLREG